jgi:hypothetical protein
MTVLEQLPQKRGIYNPHALGAVSLNIPPPPAFKRSDALTHEAKKALEQVSPDMAEMARTYAESLNKPNFH